MILMLMRETLRRLDQRARLYRLGPVGYARALGVKTGEECRVAITEWGTEPFLIVMCMLHIGYAW